jgi:hypothetical protein
VNLLNNYYSDVEGVLFDKSKTKLIQYPEGKAGNFIIPDGVTRIAYCAFGPGRRTSVIVPSSVTYVEDWAFRNTLMDFFFKGDAPSLGGPSSFYIADAQIYHDPGARGWSNSYSLWDPSTGAGYSISENAITVTAWAYSGAVTVPDTINKLSVTTISGYAFSDCTSLTSLTVGNSVTSIGDQAFSNCSGMTNVALGTSITNIGNYAFSGCIGLTTIYIPRSVTTIGIMALHFCTNLTVITVDALNPAYSSLDGLLFDKDRTELIQCPGGRSGSVTIPASVNRIEGDAFAHCSRLATIEVDALNPVFVSVGGVLFDKAQTALIQYPGGGSEIYTVPNGVTRIESGAFIGCSGLRNVTIPKSVVSIGSAAFSECSSLMEAYFEGNAPSVEWFVFDDWSSKPSSVTVYYLPGTTDWGTTFGGRPTAPWVRPYPVVLTTVPNFGIQTNLFGFIISWATNISVVVEACTNLANPVWYPLSTKTLTNGSAYFSDPQWTNYTRRYYRLRSP